MIVPKNNPELSVMRDFGAVTVIVTFAPDDHSTVSEMLKSIPENTDGYEALALMTRDPIHTVTATSNTQRKIG